MIGIIGGFGFYFFLENFNEIEIEIFYGKLSDKIVIIKVEGKEVVFILKYGKKYIYFFYKVLYKVNVYVLK